MVASPILILILILIFLLHLHRLPRSPRGRFDEYTVTLLDDDEEAGAGAGL